MRLQSAEGEELGTGDENLPGSARQDGAAELRCSRGGSGPTSGSQPERPSSESQQWHAHCSTKTHTWRTRRPHEGRHRRLRPHASLGVFTKAGPIHSLQGSPAWTWQDQPAFERHPPGPRSEGCRSILMGLPPSEEAAVNGVGMRLCSGDLIHSTQQRGLAAPTALPTHQRASHAPPWAAQLRTAGSAPWPFQLPVPKSQEEGGSWLRLWSEGASPQPGLEPVWPRTDCCRP